VPRSGSKDRRVEKTRGLLHGALASLIHEKSYDAIVVKEILGRANVGRSTFYAHFRDKDELLESSIRDMLRTSAAPSPRPSTRLPEHVLRFSLPIFERIEEYRAAGDSSMGAAGKAVIHESLEHVLTELVARDLRRAHGSRHEDRPNVPWELLAQYVASTFTVVLTWWLGEREPLPAKSANDLFRSLVLPSLGEALV
jgi:AcrR family transcriptional regulator